MDRCPKKDIRDQAIEELEAEIKSMGVPAHRARQIFLWLNSKGASGFSDMTDIPKSLVLKLEKRFRIGSIKCDEHLESALDKTEKFLWFLEDGSHVESVLIKEGGRRTICLSTQVGCRFKCPFCASGKMGFVRDLRASEIINQVLMVQKICAIRATNIVFMGMGEPLDNYDNLARAIRVINHPDGIAIGARKITVSTCGIVPGIMRLKDLGIQVELSVSLHSASDKLRDELVPVNRKYPLARLMAACKEYYKKTGRVITLEYTLIEGVNDSFEDADRLAGFAKELKAKVNLIECSPYERPACSRVSKKKVNAFRSRLSSKGVTATIRKSRGADILAACGQLAAKFSSE